MKKIFIVAFLSVLSLNIFAADGSSGCGPGWYVAKDNSLLSSSSRSTTNGFLMPTVTFGMTFGTSNCSRHSIVKNEKEDLKFSTDNYFELAADTAKGNGQFLTAYAELMGCKQESAKSLKTQMKNNFKVLFKKDEVNPENLLKETYKIILQDSKLLKACFAV